MTAPPELMDVIVRLQAGFVRSAQPHEVFDALLPELLWLTGSEYGFIGEVWRDDDGAPYLKVFTLTDIAWDAATRETFERHRTQGIDFRRPDSLFGWPLRTGQVLVANDAGTDPRAAGLPPGHPPLRCLLAVPLFHGGELVAQVALANRPGGYDDALVARLEPLFSTVAAIAGSVRLERQRCRAEEALRHSEQRHRLTFELAGVGIGYHTLDYRLFEVNDALCRFLERPREALLGLGIEDLLHPEDLASMREVQRLHAREARLHAGGERRYLLPDGRVRWGHVSSALVRDAHGRPDHVVGFVHDIDQRKRAEAALRERDQRLGKLTAHLPAVLFELRRDAQGQDSLPYANAALQRLMGVRPEAVRTDARPLLRRLPAPDRAALLESLALSAHTLTVWHHAFRAFDDQGALRWLECVAQPERQGDGSVLWHGCIVDISERRRYEQALVDAEAAQRASAAKTRFLSRMSHELRTPLNAVIGFAQLMGLDPVQPLPAAQRERAQHIERAGAHLLGMINDVLDLARIEAGEMGVAAEALRPLPLLHEVADMLGGAAAAAGVSVQVHAPADGAAPALRADRLRLRQVLVNLLGNAIKYNHRDGWVALRLLVQDARVGLQVRDSGIGMDALQLAQLWQPFNRLGAERSSVEGTGIGLALTRRMVELMDGHIEVRSRPGQGSTFTVWLPAA